MIFFFKTIAGYTQSPCDFSLEENKKFSMIGDNILGKVKNFKKDETIELQWRMSDWSSDVQDSIVKMFFKSNGTSSTDFKLEHFNIDSKYVDSVKTGWNEIFLGGIKKSFGMSL